MLNIRLQEDKTAKVQLLCIPNILSPLKRMTLPLLELMACLIGARLLHYLCFNTPLNRNAETLSIDFSVALNWIRGDPNRWQPRNRNTSIYDTIIVTTLSRISEPSGSYFKRHFATRTLILGYLVE
ncbi:hypothetical protein AVEN_177976-1 [Araneus ventricosus]|uniref:Uncharacterized protein n=1 Tax=Araneus ventricosus TaxID=182803 RepID=A0A4Y2EHZ8_ARAVE|nr:hypothetical protein AVEN_177976-1 [Araneus ventricosus]